MAADPSYDPTEFQDVLRAWMDRNGFSQMAAAQTIGISQGIINRWLKPFGDSYLVQPDVGALEKLAATRGFGTDIMQLKRMTGRLSPADLAVLTKLTPKGPPDHRLEGLVSDIRAQWPQLEENERDIATEVTRVLFRLHHRRSRKPRQPRATEEGENPSLRALLTVAYA